MNLKTKFLIVLKPFFRNKKNIFTILLLSIGSLIIIAIFSFNSILNNYLENGLGKDIVYRTMFVDYNENIEDEKTATSNIAKFKHVESALSRFEHLTGVNVTKIGENKVTGDFEIKGVSLKNNLHIAYGSNITGDNQIICPVGFALNQNTDEIIAGNVDLINMKKYLNKKMKTNDYITTFSDTILDYTVYYDFKIVGLYNNSSSYIDENICYASLATVAKINSESEKYAENSPGGKDSIIVYVDDAKNVQSVIDELGKSGYTAGPTFELNTNLFLFVNIFSVALTIIVMILSVVIIIITNNKKINDKIFEVNLYRSLGYSIDDIKSLLLIENFITSIISVLLAVIIVLIILLAIKIVLIFNPFIFMKMPIFINYLSVVISLLVVFISMVIGTLFFQKKLFNKSLIIGLR